jgi:hypothetical protein
MTDQDFHNLVLFAKRQGFDGITSLGFSQGEERFILAGFTKRPNLVDGNPLVLIM